MEKEINPYSKLDSSMLGWIDDYGTEFQEEGESAALIEATSELLPRQRKFLRGHGVNIRDNERYPDLRIFTMHTIKPDQILCLASKPFVLYISLSRRLYPTTSDRIT